MKLNKETFVISAIVLIFILLFAFLENSEKIIPQTIYFRVLDENKNPITNATCKADILGNDINIDDKSFIEIRNIITELPSISASKPSDKLGYYKLETGLNSSVENFEIKIVCVSPKNKDIGYKILNSSDMPCEFLEKGDVIIC